MHFTFILLGAVEKQLAVGTIVALLVSAAACGGDDDGHTGVDAGGTGDGGGDVDAGEETDGGVGGPPEQYVFGSRFAAGESSVAHAGQTARNVLIQALDAEIKAISVGVLDGSLDPTLVDDEGEVVARLNAFVRAGSADLGTRALPGFVEDGDTTCQETFENLGGANLIDKLAGEDDATDHMDWDGDDEGSSGPAFVGWTDDSVLTVPTGGTVGTPLGLLDALFATFEAQVRACIVDVDNCPETPGGDPLPLYVTEDGLNIAQLVEKFLFGAVNFSQITDDYLDNADDYTKGLNVDNSAQDGDHPYTALEHHWDEAFGYFGAAVNYADYTDEEIAGSGGRAEYANGYHDFDGDSCIDLSSEFNFDLAAYAAKRDLGSTTMTDLTAEIFGAFLMGRWLIATEAELADIQAQRDIVVTGLEQLMAANVIHYINSFVSDMSACGTAEFDFEDWAGHWSEMKAFALGLQFNPRSPFHTDTYDFAAIHAAMGDAPVPCTGDIDAYETALLGVRDTLQEAYGFDASDVENW